MSSSAIDQNGPGYHRLVYERQKKVTYHNQCGLVLRVIIIGFSSFYFGYCLTYFSAFSFNPRISSEVLGIQGSGSTIDSVLKGVLPIGAVIGAATSPFFMNILTRKQFILIFNLLAIIIEGIIQFTNVYVFFVCRLIQGFIIGNNMTVVPLYINELAPIQIIGGVAVFTQLMAVMGIISSYGIGLILNGANIGPNAFYHIMVSLPAAIIIVQSILFLINFIPESPNSLILKNKNEQVRKVVGMFTLEQFVDEAIRQKEIIVRGQQKYGSKQKLQTIKYTRRAYILGFELPLMQQMTGISGLITSATIIVSTVSSLQNFTIISPFIFNVAQLAGMFCTTAFIAVLGGRLLTLTGNLILGLMDIAIGIIFVIQQHWSSSGKVLFILLIFYHMIFGMTISLSIWLYVSEIIPSKSLPYSSVINWFGCSICVIFTPIIINFSGSNPAWIFFFFGIITLVFFRMNKILMVETKGRSKQEISKQFLKQN